MKLGIAEILHNASRLPSKEETINYLRTHGSPTMGVILRLAYHNNIHWDLPEGRPPYKPYQGLDAEGQLYLATNKLHYFLKDNTLPNNVKQKMFVQLLESLMPADAELLISCKDKKLPFPDLTKEFIAEAYPGIFHDEVSNQEPTQSENQYVHPVTGEVKNLPYSGKKRGPKFKVDREKEKATNSTSESVETTSQEN